LIDVLPEVEPLHLPGNGGEGEAGHPAPQPEGAAPHLR